MGAMSWGYGSNERQSPRPAFARPWRDELRLGTPATSEGGQGTPSIREAIATITCRNFSTPTSSNPNPIPSHFYTGFTENLNSRLAHHNSGGNPHSAKYRPWRRDKKESLWRSAVHGRASPE